MEALMTQKRLGIAYLKKILEEKGPAYYAKIVEDNKRALEKHRKEQEKKNVHSDRRCKDSIRESD